MEAILVTKNKRGTWFNIVVVLSTKMATLFHLITWFIAY